RAHPHGEAGATHERGAGRRRQHYAAVRSPCRDRRAGDRGAGWPFTGSVARSRGSAPGGKAVKRRALMVAAAMLVCREAAALDPSEVFAKVAPSVWAVRGLDANEKPIVYGSGVVIGPGRVVANCHVLAKAKPIQVRRSNAAYGGKLALTAAERDPCIMVR